MDPKIIKKTQESLGKIIKKPPLTEKLLSKPPFRFLHDIITSVIKTTGFMKGLFNDSELNSENVKDKDSKISFLQKAIDLVSIATGKHLSVKPAKVVAGHEPEKTNELLQAIASAVNSKVDSAECVRKVLKKDTIKEEKPEVPKDRDHGDDKRRDEEKSRRNKDIRDKGRDGERNRDREKGSDGERGHDQEEKDRKEERHREKDDRHKDREREGRHKSGRSRALLQQSDSDDDDAEENYEQVYDEDYDKQSPEIDSGDLFASDDDFDTPYNTPDEPLNATYSVNDEENKGTVGIPRQISTTGLSINGRNGPTDGEIAELESLRRKQCSRNRSNRPKAARPRREPMKQPRAEQLASFVSESKISSDKEDSFVDGNTRKSVTKIILNQRESAEADVMKIQQDGLSKARRDSLKVPKTSTHKQSPASPKNAPRANKKLDSSKAKADYRLQMDRNVKQLDSPARLTSGSQKMSVNEKSGSHSAGKALDKQDNSAKDRLSNVGKNRSTTLDSKKPRTKNRRDSMRDSDDSPRDGKLVETLRKQKAVMSEAAKGERSKKRSSTENMLQDDAKASDILKKTPSNEPSDESSKTRRSLKQELEQDISRGSHRKSGLNSESVHTDVYYKRKTTDAWDKRRKSNFDMLSSTDRAHQRRDDDSKENEAPLKENELVNGDHKPEHPPRMQRPSSAKGSRRRMEEPVEHSGNDPGLGDDDLPPQVQQARTLARPSSARPAPPKRKEDVISNEPAMRLGSGKPQNLIIDDGRDSDEDDTFVVEESAPPPVALEQSTMKLDVDEDEDDHGGLVKKIMETKKEYEEPRRTAIERPTISDAQRRKQREAVQKEIDKLRGSIQTLTRSANPLGKIMDYVQEDLDSMQKELEKWKLENKEHTLELKREKAITERAVEPLKVQLTDIDQAIKDQLDLIGAVKSNIIRNDQKIDKMLRTIAKS